MKNFLNPWSWSTTDDDVSGEVVDSHEDCSSGDEEFQSASGSPVTVTPQQETEQGAIPVIIETEEEPSSSASFGPGARQQTMSASLTANFLSGDIQNSSFRSKATIGSLSSDIFHDSKMKSIFTDTPRMAYPRSSVRRTSDVSARGLLASDLSTRATMGSDTSSQCDLSELDRYDGGSVAEEATRSEAEDKQFPPAALLSTSHVHKQRGHSSLHILPLSSTSSSSAKNFTDLRRRFAPNTSLSSNLFTSTPRLSQERQAHQAATPQAKVSCILMCIICILQYIICILQYIIFILMHLLYTIVHTYITCILTVYYCLLQCISCILRYIICILRMSYCYCIMFRISCILLVY